MGGEKPADSSPRPIVESEGGKVGSSGVTRACLNVVGNVPDVSEALITCVTAAVTVGAMDWNRLVGTGSSGHVRSLETQDE